MKKFIESREIKPSFNKPFKDTLENLACSNTWNVQRKAALYFIATFNAKGERVVKVGGTTQVGIRATTHKKSLTSDHEMLCFPFRGNPSEKQVLNTEKALHRFLKQKFELHKQDKEHYATASLEEILEYIGA